MHIFVIIQKQHKRSLSPSYAKSVRSIMGPVPTVISTILEYFVLTEMKRSGTILRVLMYFFLMPPFFVAERSFEASELADIIHAELLAGGRERIISGCANLREASPTDITFFSGNKKYLNNLRSTAAGACIVKSKHVDLVPTGVTILISETPPVSFAKLVKHMYSDIYLKHDFSAQNVSDGVSKLASVDSTATIGEGVIIGAHTYIGPGVEIGAGTVIYPNCSIICSKLGANCVINAGCRIGQAGFGFLPNDGSILKVLQIGSVVVGDNVEIGANTCVDRGRVGATKIGDMTKIDNLVQIGHNVSIGQSCIICGQVGIAGSVTVGDGVMIGGNTGIADHVNIGPGVKIAGGSGVISDVKEGRTIGGFPAVDVVQWHRQSCILKNLSKKK